MWALIVDGSINRTFKTSVAFTHPKTEIKYPSNWITLSSDSEKAEIGLIEITYTGSHKDGEYYDNAESSLVYDASKGTVVITKSSSAKNLADVKTSKKQEANSIAYDGLSRNDWYITRKSENNTAIPSKITAYRTAVRLVCNSLKSAIDSASDVDAVAALYKNADGIDPATLTVDGSQTSVVNTTSNTITKNGHGLSNDELVTYSSGFDSDNVANDPIGGLVSGNQYYVFGKTTNTFKLSHTNSHMGDAAAISLTSVGEGSDHTFSSQGIPPVGLSSPTINNPAYKL
tara:strand:- start:25 stop:885 length:861 start_codon:yes stop_codon:yes gene_type:complete